MQDESPAQQVDMARLRSRFDEELAYGEAYQRAYQKYAAERIAANASITDDHFFDDFHASHEPIASPVGPEEWFAFLRGWKENNHLILRVLAWGILGAGAVAMCWTMLMRWAVSFVLAT